MVFPAKTAGEYSVALWVNGAEVRCSPWIRHVLPGLPHPPSCRLVGPWASRGGIVVAPLPEAPVPETQSLLQIRDAFGNVVDSTRSAFSFDFYLCQ